MSQQQSFCRALASPRQLVANLEENPDEETRRTASGAGPEGSSGRLSVVTEVRCWYSQGGAGAILVRVNVKRRSELTRQSMARRAHLKHRRQITTNRPRRLREVRRAPACLGHQESCDHAPR